MEQIYQYKSEIQEIQLIRGHLAQLAGLWTIPESESRQIGVIVEELFSNIIRFAYDDNLEHQIEIRLSKTDDEIGIEIIDDGIPFNPLNHQPGPQSDPATSDIAGMGLTLVRTFSDEIVYSRSNERNRLKITKKIKSDL
ncbi:MAG: ATP-binding protein [Bacteroidota bacterium]